jgi:ketosteroid isomerase-like protein
MSVDETRETIWRAMNEIYAGFLARDRDRVDRHIDPDATIWDSEEPTLLRGRAELDALRDRRPPGSLPGDLRAQDPVIDVWGDVALLRHILIVVDGESVVRIRNTSVWRRRDGDWRVVHNHEDVLPPL